MIITQKFNKISKKIIFSLKKKEIKCLLSRERLKLSYAELLNYVQTLFIHNHTQRTLKYLYKKKKTTISYQGFMKNIHLVSRLFKFIFHQVSKILAIKASKLFNIVDTTLIPEKQSVHINQKDWDSGRVTTRIDKNNQKIHICGSKGLVFINRFGQIYSASVLPIHFSDQNILKDPALYHNELQGILLADRGFSNKTVRERLNSVTNSIFSINKPVCRLISPYHHKQKTTLTTKEKRIYKKRWRIETLFQKLKHNYSDNKLNLTGNYHKELKLAKFYSTLIGFNLSTL